MKNVLILIALFTSTTIFGQKLLELEWEKIHQIESVSGDTFANKIRYLDGKIFAIEKNKVFQLDENSEEQYADDYQYLHVQGDIYKLGNLLVQKRGKGYSKYNFETKQWIPLKNGDIEFHLLNKNAKSNQIVAYAQNSIYISEDEGETWMSSPFTFPYPVIANIFAVNDTILLVNYDELYSKVGNGNWTKHGYVGAYAQIGYFNNAIYVAGEKILKFSDIDKKPVQLGHIESDFVSRYRAYPFDDFLAVSKWNTLYLIDKQDQLYAINKNLDQITNLYLNGDELYTIIKDTTIWKTNLRWCDEGFVGATCDDQNPATYYDKIQENCECMGESVESNCYEQTKAVLFQIYSKLNGPNWKIKKNWLSDKPLNEWYGVRTDSNGCVISLDLKFNNLEGEFPAEISELDQLQNLTLHNNHITGNIPSSLSDLQHLNRCFLSYNNLSGCFPDLPNICSSYSNGNYTTGHDGDQIAHYEGYGYNFTHNELLPFQGDFKKICEGEEQIGAPCDKGDSYEHAYIQENCSCKGLPTSESPCRVNDSTALHGIYSYAGGNHKWEHWNTNASLRKWDGITTDDDGCVTEIFSYNFTKLPSYVGDLSHLKKIKLGGSTNLTGKLPKSIGKLENLESLEIYGKMTGAIPWEIGQLSNLNVLDLGHNEFTEIPNQIGNLHKLEVLHIQYNNLSGEIPPELGQLSMLKELLLGYNKLTGTIPASLGNLDSLGILSLVENNLSGEIPDELYKLKNLHSLFLGYNQLEGVLSKEIIGLKNISRLSLSSNRLTGTIPEEFSEFHNLRKLILDYNDFEGCIFQDVLDIFCSTDNTELSHNQKLPYFGEIDSLCNGLPQIGAPCNDHNPNTIDDTIDENCQCIGTIVATQNISNITKLIIQPNPNNGQFTLQLKVKEKTKIKISVHSLVGKTLFEKEIQGNNLQESINLAHLPSGIYFLEVSTENEILTETVVVE